MIIGVLKERANGEKRVALTPDSAKRLVSKNGLELLFEEGLGEALKISDEEYAVVGAKASSRENILKSADVVIRIALEKSEIAMMKEGAISISSLDPYNNKDILDAFNSSKITGLSLEMIPRTTRAQKMDILSSQANIAGYAMVILATNSLQKILPMMTTPSGTIRPARVFVIGVGVAGLQAIATAKRLGAIVEAFDTRPVVEEQVKSLGAKFVKVDLGEMGQTKDGYAMELTPEQIAKQQEAMKKTALNADIVITTAKLFGRKAPIVITKDVVENMKKGSVIVDMAVETGGNVEGSVNGETVDINGVKVIGISNLPAEFAESSSQMLANNIYNLVDEFWDNEAGALVLNPSDDIVEGIKITENGEIVNKNIKSFYNK